jgi:hypothetical protein
MVDHIYGRIDLLAGVDRPHMFLKELSLYVDYLKREIDRVKDAVSAKQQRYLSGFRKNLEEGIRYYEGLLPELQARAAADVRVMKDRLAAAAQELRALVLPSVQPVA